ncbi:hypothetical protein [Dongia sp.]|uniref:hypothetical protein n=1 Tax=Dongia sp. TaxID=1977262 RepID=UPI0035B12CC8
MYRSSNMNEGVGAASGIGLRALHLPLLLGLAALLAACAGQPHKVGTAMRAPKNPAHGILEPGTAKAGTPIPASPVPQSSGPESAAALAPQPAPAIIWQSADKLMGLAAEELQAALGKPARIRDEDAGRIYQYIGSDCVLDLFLYPQDTGGYRVSYAEARSVTAEKKPVDACLKSLPAPIVADNVPSS